MMTPSMIDYRISQLQRDIATTWDKYRRLQWELSDLLKTQAAMSGMSESTTSERLLTEQISISGHTRYRDQE